MKIEAEDPPVQLDFTGSMYGYGGIMNANFRATGDDVTAGTVVFSGGGSVALEDLFYYRGADGADQPTQGPRDAGILEFSIAQITLTQGAVYVFKRQTGF
jgi:hypothetical protein